MADYTAFNLDPDKHDRWLAIGVEQGILNVDLTPVKKPIIEAPEPKIAQRVAQSFPEQSSLPERSVSPFPTEAGLASPPPTAEGWPETLTYSPVLAMRAIAAGHGRAWFVWALARELDRAGSGVIPRERLQAFVASLGLPGSSFRRWLSDARRLGLLGFLSFRSGPMLTITGERRAAEIVGVGDNGVGKKRATVELAKLAGDDWRAWAWAGFIAILNGRPMSRAKMRELTGVPERTQQEYEKQAGIEATINYAHDDRDPHLLTGIQEHERPHAFKWHDKRRKQTVVVWRTPDTRRAPKGVICAGEGRSRKVNQALRAGLLILEQAHVENPFRLFHDRYQGAEKTLRRFGRADIPPWDERAIREVYHKQPGGVACQEWGVIHA